MPGVQKIIQVLLAKKHLALRDDWNADGNYFKSFLSFPRKWEPSACQCGEPCKTFGAICQTIAGARFPLSRE